MKNKILVIEDDADINTLLKKILERAGYEAETAFSGTEGRLLLKLNTYDLVLLDVYKRQGLRNSGRMANTPRNSLRRFWK